MNNTQPKTSATAPNSISMKYLNYYWVAPAVVGYGLLGSFGLGAMDSIIPVSRKRSMDGSF